MLPSIKTENQYARVNFYHSDGTGIYKKYKQKLRS